MLIEQYRARFEAELPRLTRYAYTVSVNFPIDAHDVLAEGYMRGANGASGLKHERYFASWMYRILKNAAIDLCREHNRAFALPLKEAVLIASPDNGFAAAEEDRTLTRALDEIPHHSAEVMRLVYIESFTYPEAAEALRIPIGTVRSRINRGLNILRRTRVDPRLTAPA